MELFYECWVVVDMCCLYWVIVKFGSVIVVGYLCGIVLV